MSMISPTAVFCAGTFLANYGIAITGWWDPAVWFFFIYVIGDFAEAVDCDVCGPKHAMFYQALSTGAVLPFILWNLRTVIKEHHNKSFLAFFLTATAIGTPIGSYLNVMLSSNLIFIIVGSVTFLTEVNLITKMKGEKAAAAAKAAEAEEADEENDGLVSGTSGGLDVAGMYGTKPKVMGSITSLISAYLGGLAGVRGPPLIVLIRLFPYPKHVVEAHASLILAVHTYARIIWYIAQSAADGTIVWFEAEFQYLYLYVVLFGLMGYFIGNIVKGIVDVDKVKMASSFILLISGILNLICGSIKVHTNNS